MKDFLELSIAFEAVVWEPEVRLDYNSGFRVSGNNNEATVI